MIAPPPCQLNVPAITAQADGSGVQTGHVTGSCSFAWHSRNEIQYKDRWHVLGISYHKGGEAGVFVRQPIDYKDYGLYGYYREVVRVYDPTGTLRQVVKGPISEIEQ